MDYPEMIHDEFLLHRQKTFRVINGRFNFPAIPDYSGIAQQFLNFFVIKICDFHRI